MTDHTDVGAYSLGLLEENDRRAFESHLDGCGRCARELAEFSGMRELLVGLAPVMDGDAGDGKAGDGEDPPPPDPVTRDAGGDVAELLRRRKVDVRRQRRGAAVIRFAVGVILLAGGAVTGVGVASHGTFAKYHGGTPADLLVWGETRSATDPRTGVSGVLAMENKGWGTHIALDLSHITGPRTCELIAYSTSGVPHVMTEWAIPAVGYGVPGAPGHLQIHGGTALRRSDLARFEIRDQSGGTLLTIPV